MNLPRFLARWFGREDGRTGTRSAPRGDPHRWTSNGGFRVAVVGEAYRQPALTRFVTANGVADDGHGIACDARLVPEADNPHDELAVAVYLGSEHVGYLSREHAGAFRRRLKIAKVKAEFTICAAKVVTGKQRRGGGGKYGVTLDLDPFE